MKRLIAIAVLTASIAATSAFGQGYFYFASGKSQVYDGFTGSTAALGSTVNVAFLWGAASTVPTVDQYGSQSLASGTSASAVSYTAAQAWTAILNGQFTLANDAGTSSLAKATTSATGAIAYPTTPAAAFGVTGTTAGTTYTIYEISWSSAYATPQLASAANSAVGWSIPVQYTPVTNIGTPTTFQGLFPAFGTFAPAPVPEPATIALAGLGGLALLALRRKK